ncbi:phosphonate metabolism protein/1,5-bisphosphokinase (PRPP-forming) PhnN [Stutzerimonas tarimensis]|uniref:Ribose 1,5-bisphosphate phosphokinase PhnN n=1 Tax=Stutzerimonas tarimensis TaxID=1507735 RepID=A0ABV7T042_9GAMM
MKGRLIYLVGPSGAGKDSLLEACRERLLLQECRIAPRQVTRVSGEPEGGTSCISPDEFEALERSAAFALHWHANGIAYGIPLVIDQWLAEGYSVVVNGSREYLPQALCRYPGMLTVLLSVQPAVLRQRLLQRGRESLDEVEARLARNRRFADGLESEYERVIILDNSGPLSDTAERFLQTVCTGRTTAQDCP